MFRQALGDLTERPLESVIESSFDMEVRKATAAKSRSRKNTDSEEPAQDLTASDEYMLAVATKLDKEKVFTAI